MDAVIHNVGAYSTNVDHDARLGAREIANPTAHLYKLECACRTTNANQ